MIVRCGNNLFFLMLYTTSGACCVERASVRLICIFSLFLARCRAQPQSFRRIIFFRESWDFSGVGWSSVRIRRGGLPSFCRKIKDRKHDSQSTDGTLPPSSPHTHFFLHKKAYQRQAGRQRSTTTQTGMTVTDPDGEEDDEGLALGSIFTVSRTSFRVHVPCQSQSCCAVLYNRYGFMVMGYGNRSLLVHHRPNRQSQYMKT